MFSYGSPPVSSNRFGHNLLPALICDPHPPYTRKCFAPAPTLSPPSTIPGLSLAKPNLPRDGSTPICYRKFLYVKCIFHSSNVPPYSHFLRSLSSTFVVNENCFSEKWPLKRHSFRRNGVRMSLQVVRCELLGTSSDSMRRGSHPQGDTRYGLDRVELLRWRPFPVRFTATVET